MAFSITTTKDPGSSRIFLRRRTASPVTKPLEPVIQPTDPLDRLSTRRRCDTRADVTPAQRGSASTKQGERIGDGDVHPACIGEQQSGLGDVEELGAALGEFGQQVDDVEVVQQAGPPG